MRKVMTFLLAVTLGSVMAVGLSVPSAVSAGAATTVAPAKCQSGDSPELDSALGLQGQVPLADRLSGRAAMGYSCNLKLIGGYQGNGAWATLDTYKNCAYFGDAAAAGGTVVVDVSDPSHPQRTAYLTSPAMQNPWESLRVNARRGLLVADHSEGSADAPGTSPLDIYDVSQDCRHPRLLTSVVLKYGIGHEGWFEPDGMVYYDSGGNHVTPIDLSDPRHPIEMASWPLTIHGGSVSDDGTRGYFCQIDLTTGAGDHFVVVDTSQVAERRLNAQFKVIGSVPLSDSFACQSTYPLLYRGHHYAIQYGELPKGAQNMFAGTLASINPTLVTVGAFGKCPTGTDSNFNVPHMIDIEDEKNPKIVSTFLMQVDDPANCPLVSGDSSPFMPPGGVASMSSGELQGRALVNAAFIYDAHHCSPDRLHDPTILACEQFSAGLRVYDVREPANPKEFAYYNVGTFSATNPTVDYAISRPVVRTDLGQIWFTTGIDGFHVAQFENDVWPFAGQRCSGAASTDRFVQQYDLTDSCSGGEPNSAPAAAETGIPNTSTQPESAISTGVLLFALGIALILAVWALARTKASKAGA